MREFSELIRDFDKIRDYMRDFYIYGFKSRNDFKQKSPRTYDNEKRRIESYMGQFMRWDYSKKGKTSFISMDCSKISVNPFYNAWKSKIFTPNDIMLHFYILDVLKSNNFLNINQLTDKICEQSEQLFDIQTVRNKCNQYIKQGIIVSEKSSKSVFYKISNMFFSNLLKISPNLSEAVKFFQGVSPFGEIGSFILDNENFENDIFSFKHNYFAHTLEDEILFEILKAIRQNQEIEFINFSEKTKNSILIEVIPLKIFVSASTGRRYLCVYKKYSRRFFNYRLDHIKSVKIKDFCYETNEYKEKLEKILNKVWGVSFGGANRIEIICMKLYIDELRESYILERIVREGHKGELLHIDNNVFLYTKEIFDSNEMSPWIKTFMGRILQLEGTNQILIDRFYNDINKMKEIYDGDG